MVKRNSKTGFSLVEILISMLIMSVMFVVGTKIMTQKQKDELQIKAHGYYECFFSGGGLHYAYSKTGDEVPSTAVAGSCPFTVPTRNNSVFMVTILYPNDSGIIYNDYFINRDTVRIVPPAGNAGARFILEGGAVETIERPAERDPDFTYDLIRNNIMVANPNSNAMRAGCGAPGGGGGAVIVNW